jgi:hypothetical protein
MALPDYQTLKRRYEIEQHDVDAHRKNRASIVSDATVGGYHASPAGLAAKAHDTITYTWLLKHFSYIA